MPSLTNARHEMYCQNIVAGMTQRAAHKAAGFQGGNNNATTLHHRPEIQARISELIAEKGNAPTASINPLGDIDTAEEIESAMADGIVSKNWIVAKLVELTKVATECGQFTPANKSLELLIRLMGYFPSDKPGKGKALEKPARPEAPLLPFDKLNALFDRIETPPAAVEIVVKQ